MTRYCGCDMTAATAQRDGLSTPAETRAPRRPPHGGGATVQHGGAACTHGGFSAVTAAAAVQHNG